MMSSYTIIPVIALMGYVILFVAFAASKKTKLTNSFMLLLLVFSLWTAGSLFLRMGIQPSTGFWFYVSIDALFVMLSLIHICLVYSCRYNRTIFQKNRTLSPKIAVCVDILIPLS